MTTSADLQALIVAALTGATDAGPRVFSPRDWPTTLDALPDIRVQSPTERKESLGRGVPQFTVTATIRVEARATAPAASGDAGAGTVLAALAALKRQIEVAVVNSYALTNLIQQFSSIDSKTQVSAEAKQHVGELTMDFALEFYQGFADFAPPATTDITEMDVAVTTYPPTGLTVHLDPNLDFTDPDNSGFVPTV